MSNTPEPMQQSVLSEEQMFQLQEWLNGQMRGFEEAKRQLDTDRSHMETDRRQMDVDRRQLETEIRQVAAQAKGNQYKSGPASKAAAKPDQYTGSRDINDIKNWFERIRAHAELCDIPDEKYTQIATTYLNKEALIWYRQYPDARHWSWSEFQERLIHRFSNPVHDEDIMDKWEKIRQTGNVFDYSSYFEKLRIALPDEVQRGHQNAPILVLRKYIQGLKPKTRREIELKAPTSLEEATRAAYKIDSHFNKDINPNTFRTNHVSNRPAYHPAAVKTGDQPMEIYNVQKHQPRDMSKVECHGCHEFGHYKRNCPKARHQ